MKAAGSLALVLLAIVASTVVAKGSVVRGVVVDQACYLKDHRNTGDSHLECAVACAKKGQPVGLVTSDGRVYQIVGEWVKDHNARVLPYVGRWVEAVGEVTDRDGKMGIDVATFSRIFSRGNTVDVIGELIDMKCYMNDAGKRGLAHSKCARDCISNGSTLAILLGDGAVYEIAGEYSRSTDFRDRMTPLLSLRVRGRGQVSEGKSGVILNATSVERVQ